MRKNELLKQVAAQLAAQLAPKALNDALAAGAVLQIGNEYYLPVTEDNVRATALNFIDEYGIVTTLQIKEKLREDGYYVKQQYISEVMSELVDEGLFDVTDVYTNGIMHRLFFSHQMHVNHAINKFEKFKRTHTMSTFVPSGYKQTPLPVQFPARKPVQKSRAAKSQVVARFNAHNARHMRCGHPHCACNSAR